MSINPKQIIVAQKEWAFTSSDEERTEIKTGLFGPCYAVSFVSGKYCALAHIDDTTEVESIQQIFNRFAAHQISTSNIEVTMKGGCYEWEESRQWGEKMLAFFLKQGVPVDQINTDDLFSEKGRVYLPYPIREWYHLGLCVDAASGCSRFLTETDVEIQHYCDRRITLMDEEDQEREFPLNETTLADQDEVRRKVYPTPA